MIEIGTTVCVAFMLDLLFGDPRYAFHPVRLIGHTIDSIETLLRGLGCAGKGGGILLAVVTCGGMLVLYLSLRWLVEEVHPFLPLLFDLFLVYSFLAVGDLLRHIRPVAAALETMDLVSARQALSLTVGRNVNVLDREGVARAAIETLAENFVDGFLSPLFWYIAGGAASWLLGDHPMRGAVGCMLLFKCASTLDSMVGYKNERYLRFGWAGARLDDWMNLAPARLSVFFLWTGALLTGLNGSEGIRVFLRDRLKHESPNSAHPESFAAGALGIRLGGPTLYSNGVKTKPWLGDGLCEVNENHVRKAMRMVHAGAWSAVGCAVLFSLIFWMQ